MKDISLKLLERQLRKITWFPIGMMAFIFLVAVAGLLYREQQSRLRQIRAEFAETISLQEPMAAQEILLDMRNAIKDRMHSTLTKWGIKYPKVQACIRFQMPHDRFDECSSPKDVVGRELKASEIYIDNGVDRLATIEYWVTPQREIEDYLPPFLVLTVLLSVVSALLFHNLLVRHLKRRIVNPLLSEIKQNERNKTLAEAIQMIAHDVKRPFQILRRATEAIKRAKNKNTFDRLTTEVIPNIEKGITSVEAMMKDVLEIGSDVPLVKSELKPIELMNDAIREIFLVHTHADIEFLYDLTHENQILGDREKLMRVFLNLIENAVHALQGKGRIWIDTKEYLDGTKQMAQFCIGNNGPSISEGDQRELFKQFFTKSKKGNGLGLAIVKKIITAHGGDIWCTSTEKGTQFFFTLPMATTPEHTPVKLPAYSIDITLIADEKSLANPVRNIQTASFSASNETNILVFDDDKLVHDCWLSTAKKQGIRFHHYWSWEDFLRQGASPLAHNATAFVDIGFKGSDFNGYDIARRLRRIGIRKLYAITGSLEAAKKSGLFDDVFGKDVPTNIRGYVA